MAEASPATPAPTPAPATPALADDPTAEIAAFTNFFSNLSKRTDIMLALGVVSILVVLILPLPTWGMDISLSFSITFSVLILMVALFVEKPLDFNTFPTILLLATMIRLALNLAS
ncbi:MAG: FHIPEP family type III secretion protein, partial [Alphaproteobacteria bacterium]